VCGDSNDAAVVMVLLVVFGCTGIAVVVVVVGVSIVVVDCVVIVALAVVVVVAGWLQLTTAVGIATIEWSSALANALSSDVDTTRFRCTCAARSNGVSSG